MSTFLTTIRSPRRMAIKPHESSGGWLAAGISIVCLANLRGLDSITTLRPDSSGAHSGIVKSAPGAPEGISGGRFPAQFGACVSAYRQMQSAETTDSRVHLGR